MLEVFGLMASFRTMERAWLSPQAKALAVERARVEGLSLSGWLEMAVRRTAGLDAALRAQVEAQSGQVFQRFEEEDR